MKYNIAQETEEREDGYTFILNDWYPKAIPENLVMENMVYLDSTYSFACFHSKDQEGFKMGYASGNYLHSHFLVGEQGKVSVGKYTILEATNISANDSVCIGDHCMLSWGSYITDSWLNENSYSSLIRKDILKKTGIFNSDIFYVLDLDLWYKILLHGNLYSFGETVSSFRVSNSSASVKVAKKQREDVSNFIKKTYNNKEYKVSWLSYKIRLLKTFILTEAKKILYKYIIK